MEYHDLRWFVLVRRSNATSSAFTITTTTTNVHLVAPPLWCLPPQFQCVSIYLSIYLSNVSLQSISWVVMQRVLSTRSSTRCTWAIHAYHPRSMAPCRPSIPTTTTISPTKTQLLPKVQSTTTINNHSPPLLIINHHYYRTKRMHCHQPPAFRRRPITNTASTTTTTTTIITLLRLLILTPIKTPLTRALHLSAINLIIITSSSHRSDNLTIGPTFDTPNYGPITAAQPTSTAISTTQTIWISVTLPLAVRASPTTIQFILPAIKRTTWIALHSYHPTTVLRSTNTRCPTPIRTLPRRPISIVPVRRRRHRDAVSTSNRRRSTDPTIVCRATPIAWTKSATYHLATVCRRTAGPSSAPNPRIGWANDASRTAAMEAAPPDDRDRTAIAFPLSASSKKRNIIRRGGALDNCQSYLFIFSLLLYLYIFCWEISLNQKGTSDYSEFIITIFYYLLMWNFGMSMDFSKQLKARMKTHKKHCCEVLPYALFFSLYVLNMPYQFFPCVFL